MKIKVFYPSGTTFEIEGNFMGLMPLPDNSSHAVMIEATKTQKINRQTVKAKSLFACDPRGVFRNETGLIIYDPVDHLVELWDAWGEWFSTHKDWPANLRESKP